ncbi:hypothetical protein TorRG33x02_061530 [Trema orientale]|uniref:Uncharacterized protein n=1 Tax=Trema orientale TaxID=63057 RepID=A0A2P5FJW9_TREOI|nr:hypothetical protein TorRG33x02_061530 [Trema orientale]
MSIRSSSEVHGPFFSPISSQHGVLTIFIISSQNQKSSSPYAHRDEAWIRRKNMHSPDRFLHSRGAQGLFPIRTPGVRFH